VTKINRTILNRLLNTVPKGVVYTSQWLSKLGYSLDLQNYYRKSNWFRSIGRGAMIRIGEEVTYVGGIYALQEQLNMTVHPAGTTALSFHGRLHYLQLKETQIVLFGNYKEKLPSWWHKHDWKVITKYHTTTFLPPNLGLIEISQGGVSIKISNKVRAMLEVLLLTPKSYGMGFAFEIMLGLNNLRPDIVQELLEECSSIKVKRLFLYFAEKADHGWLKYLDLEKIDLGKGKRSLVKDGVYIKKYKITVYKEFEDGTLRRSS